MKTPCDLCVFNIRANGEQVGCVFHRLEKFPKTWDETTKSYIIERICTRFRVKPVNKDQVIEESRVKVDCIIIFKGKYDCLDRLINRLLDFRPNSIKVVNSNVDIVLNSYCKNRNISVITHLTSQEDGDLIDEAVSKCKGNYYLVLYETDYPEIDVIEELNQLVEEDLKQVSLIEGEEYSGLIVNKALHRYLGGNFSIPIYDKVRKIYSTSELLDVV